MWGTASAVLLPGSALSRGERRRFRLTIRARITLSVALLIAIGGGALVTGLNLFMRYGPVWAIPAFPGAFGADTADIDLSGLVAPAPDEPDPLGGLDDLAISVPSLEIRDANDVFSTLLWSSLIALLVIVALGALAAWLLAGRLLAPLHRINAAARAATPARLGHRVALQGPRDELTDLSDTLDDMLERLERAYRAQQLFAANAAHELRTPLATQKAMLDVLLDGPEPTAADYRLTATRLREVNARSIELGEALLNLTRAQLGAQDGAPGRGGSGGSEATAVTQLLADSIEEHRDAASARGLTFETQHTPHAIWGDRSFLCRLLDNLLGNATRYASPDSEIAVSWQVIDGHSVLRIDNAADPIPLETRERLHEPFVRGTQRVRSDSGSGLGLAIAEAVAHAHGGSLRVLAADAGTPAESFGIEVTFPPGRTVTE